MKTVKYKIECLSEDTSPKGHFDHPDDLEHVLEGIANGNIWAWCVIKVTATIDGVDLEGTTYLGACSYADEEDFRSDDDNFDDMKGCARDDLFEKIRAAQAIDLEAV